MPDYMHTADRHTASDAGPREPDSAELMRDSMRGLTQLAMTEASLALTSFPLLIGVCLARVVLLCLSIFGLSLGVALALYNYSGSALLALGAFLLLQSAIVMLLGKFQKSLQRELTLPVTRAEVGNFTQLFREAFSEETASETASART